MFWRFCSALPSREVSRALCACVGRVAPPVGRVDLLETCLQFRDVSCLVYVSVRVYVSGERCTGRMKARPS